MLLCVCVCVCVVLLDGTNTVECGNSQCCVYQSMDQNLVYTCSCTCTRMMYMCPIATLYMTVYTSTLLLVTLETHIMYVSQSI